MKVKIKKLNENAILPFYSTKGSAGMDMTAVSMEYNSENDYYIYHTGIAIEIPVGYVGLVFPRSSNRKTEAYLCNHVGIIDSDYRGEVLFCYKLRDTERYSRNTNGKIDPSEHKPYEIGDRIGQMIIIPYPYIEIEECNELSNTDRGKSGFGSTGK